MVVASGGNAGLANAYAAAQLGVPATVFVPESAPAVKVRKLEAIGATVIQGGAEYAVAYEAAIAHAAETGAVYCHAYDQPEIAAGAGTVGSELLDQLGGVDTVLVAVGGGGLMAGIAAAVEGHAKVVAVEPANAPTLHAALAAGVPGGRGGVRGRGGFPGSAAASGRSALQWRSGPASKASWCPTTKSSPRAGGSGTSTAWWWSTVPRRPLPPCTLAPTFRRQGSAWRSFSAAPTRIRPPCKGFSGITTGGGRRRFCRV